MAVEMILQSADESGRLESCASFFDLVIDQSVRVTVISESSLLRKQLYRCLERELAQTAAVGGCGGTAAGRFADMCHAHGAAGVAQLVVVAAAGPPQGSVLDATVARFLQQSGASAIGVAPLGSPMSLLPPAVHRYQAAWYSADICDVASDVLAAAGVEPEKRKAFISYSRADRRAAIQLAEALGDQRFAVYLDTRSNPPASLWEEVLRDSLVDCALVVVLETDNSFASTWVAREIGFARSRRAGVVAVTPDGMPRFKYMTARFAGPPSAAGPFVARQHRLSLSSQRESRVSSVMKGLTWIGQSATQHGATVTTSRRSIGVFARPVTVRELRQTAANARVSKLPAITFAPEPVLSARRHDSRWLHAETNIEMAAGTLWSLLAKV